MAVTHHDELVRKLIKALNLPKETVWFEFRVAVDEPIAVKCGYYPNPVSDCIEFGVYHLEKICDAQYRMWADPHLDGAR